MLPTLQKKDNMRETNIGNWISDPYSLNMTQFLFDQESAPFHTLENG